MTTITSGSLSKAQYNELYKNDSAYLKGQTSLVDTADSILSENYTTTQKIEHSIEGRDCQDDGKISTGSKFVNFFKGIGNSIKNGVKSLFTPKGFLKAAAITAACVLGGPVVTGAVLAVSAVKGAITVGKGAYAAANATTDEEAEQAWQNIGSGSFQVAASLAPMKGVAGAVKSSGGIAASLKASTAGKALSGVKTSVAKNGIKGSLESAKNTVTNKTKSFTNELKYAKENYTAAKESGKTTAQALKEAGKSYTKQENFNNFQDSKIYQKYDKLKDTYNTAKTNGAKTYEAAKAAFKTTNTYGAINQTAKNMGMTKTIGGVIPAGVNLLDDEA